MWPREEQRSCCCFKSDLLTATVPQQRQCTLLTTFKSSVHCPILSECVDHLDIIIEVSRNPGPKLPSSPIPAELTGKTSPRAAELPIYLRPWLAETPTISVTSGLWVFDKLYYDPQLLKLNHAMRLRPRDWTRSYYSEEGDIHRTYQLHLWRCCLSGST